MAMPSGLPPPAASGRRGALKVYLGSAAGVGKTYRMLNDAVQLRQRGIDVAIAWIETHGRAETEAQLRDLEVIPRRRIAYRNLTLEEMDTAAVLARRPRVAVVDELAHTNVPGSVHEKRWQDVIALLDAGISVITAMNVQHLESLGQVLETTLGLTVRETVPDWVIGLAEEAVTVDISSQELRQRLVDGKIYAPDKVASALANFFTEENLTVLRELALREVASSVDRLREENVEHPGRSAANGRSAVTERVLVAMSSDAAATAILLRKASRVAGRLNRGWYCVYVQTPEEDATRIPAPLQRALVDNIQMAQRLGAEVAKLRAVNVAEAIADFARSHAVTLVIVGRSRPRRLARIRRSVVDRLLGEARGFDVLVVATDGEGGSP